jgi:osmotically-inducible protein OsmY
MSTKFLFTSLFCFVFLGCALPAFSNPQLAVSVSVETDGAATPGLAANTPNSDKFVTDQVNQALTAVKEFSADLKNITVETKAGVVTLSGTVSDQATKTAIGQKVMNIPGVKGVDNKIEVEQ